MTRTIISFVLIFSALAILFLLVFPAHNRFQRASVELEAKEDSLGNLEEYMETIERIYALIEREEDLKKLETSLPRDPYIPSLFLFLSRIGYGGVEIDDLGSFNIRDSRIPGIKNIEIPFEATGNYNNLKRMIYSIERLSRVIEIERMTLSYDEDDDLVTMELRLKTYSY